MSGEARKSSNKQVIMRSAQGESSAQRRREASRELDTGGDWTSEVILSEAECTTEWYKAIERRDCKALIQQLQSTEAGALLLKTGKAGRTVLHVGAIQGSWELVDAIKGFRTGPVGVQTAQKLENAIDGRCNLTADDIAVHILGYKDRGFFKVSEGGVDVPRNILRLIDVWQSNYELTREDLNRLEETLTTVLEKGRYEGLKKSFDENVDYNFVVDYNVGYTSGLFLFHHACSRVGVEGFIEDVRRRIDDEGLKKLMNIRDLQGRTPWHVAVAVASLEVSYALSKFAVGCYADVRDGRGWTPLDVAATQPYPLDRVGSRHMVQYVEWWLKEYRGDCSDTEDSFYRKSLHLAVLHNNVAFIRYLSVWFKKYNRKPQTTWIRIGKERWCGLTLALLLGNEEMFHLMYDKASPDFPEERHLPSKRIPAICLAAAMGNVRILRQLLNNPRFDPYEKDYLGNTSLHYAATGVLEPNFNGYFDTPGNLLVEPRLAHTYVCLADVPNVAWLDALYDSSLQVETKFEKGFVGRKGCITMLLQAGLEMWAKNKEGIIADPGDAIIDDDFIIWWHEKIAKETLEARNNLKQGGIAISVIDALIATASYVGPLQPPLGYGVDPLISDPTLYAHIWKLSVQIFMMSNTISFYLAIASLMLAVVPSLPMRQKSIWKELESMRKIVAWAISVLLVSVFGILISYTAGLLAVMPNHEHFFHLHWTSYVVVVAVPVCLFGFILFTIRVLGLSYPDKCRWVVKMFRLIYSDTCRWLRKVWRNALK